MSFRDSIIEILRNLKPELKQKYAVRSLGLFGSVTRNDFSPGESDIDIIVEFSKPVGIEFIDLADYLESQINRLKGK